MEHERTKAVRVELGAPTALRAVGVDSASIGLDTGFGPKGHVRIYADACAQLGPYLGASVSAVVVEFTFPNASTKPAPEQPLWISRSAIAELAAGGLPAEVVQRAMALHEELAAESEAGS